MKKWVMEIIDSADKGWRKDTFMFNISVGFRIIMIMNMIIVMAILFPIWGPIWLLGKGVTKWTK